MYRSLIAATLFAVQILPTGIERAHLRDFASQTVELFPAAPSCGADRIPVCTPKWEWDCIEGTEVTPNHCDVYSRGCEIE